MEKNKELLLVHSAMQKVALSESVNIMLTPQFYTLKRENIPVKYAYQAKKIAQSLFDGLLDEGGEYDYLVYKEEDAWVFIAYDIEKITDFLESKGIESTKVVKIYFAQQSVDIFTQPYILSENQVLMSLDDTVVLAPRMALEDTEEATLKFSENFLLPNKAISLKGGHSAGSFLSQQQALSFAAIFMLFAGIFVVEGLRYGGDSKEVKDELQSLYEAYPTLESSYTRQSIIDKYSSLDKKERSKRDMMKSLSGMIFKGVKLISVHVDEKKIKAIFLCNTPALMVRIEKLAKKENYSVKANGTQLTIEETL